MQDPTKHEAIRMTLESAGYREIRFSLTPVHFRFEKGHSQSELEFSRAYFDDTPIKMLKTRMHQRILPALKDHPDTKVHVAERFLAIIAIRRSGDNHRRRAVDSRTTKPLTNRARELTNDAH